MQVKQQIKIICLLFGPNVVYTTIVVVIQTIKKIYIHIIQMVLYLRFVYFNAKMYKHAVDRKTVSFLTKIRSYINKLPKYLEIKY